MQAFGRALEYAMVACAWLRNEYVRDFVQRNRVVHVRVSESYTDRGVRRRRIRYVAHTMRQVTAIAAHVVESRHVA